MTEQKQELRELTIDLQKWRPFVSCLTSTKTWEEWFQVIEKYVGIFNLKQVVQENLEWYTNYAKKVWEDYKLFLTEKDRSSSSHSLQRCWEGELALLLYVLRSHREYKPAFKLCWKVMLDDEKRALSTSTMLLKLDTQRMLTFLKETSTGKA